MAIKETEYNNAFIAIRHQLDYRLKTFNFALAFNGTLMAVVFEYFTKVPAQIGGCIFGLFATIAFYFIERRAVFVAKEYANQAMVLEKELGISLLTEVIGNKLRRSKIRYRFFFAFLYFLMLALWLLGFLFVVL